MSLMNKRIDNILKVMRDAKDYECKMIWNSLSPTEEAL